MRKLRTHQVIAYAVMLSLGIAFLYSVDLITTQPDMTVGGRLAQTNMAGRAGGTLIDPAGTLLLRLNKAENVAGLQIVYLGIVDGRLNLGIRIPQLDPVYTYPHSIPLKQAKEGFALAGRAFILLSASDIYIRLKLNDNPTG